MNKRVLVVDDEPNLLQAVQRTMRNDFEVETCADPRAALNILKSSAPFAAVVSDMRMPNMDGVRFLSAAKEIAPDMVRIMLTGNADQQTAINAVNEGEIFRFLNKPTDAKVLRKVLELAVRQYELVKGERELLERTLKGSVTLLTEILSIAKPEIFGRTDRLRTKAKQIAAHFSELASWEFETAASLSLLGCIGLSPELIEKAALGMPLTEPEALEFNAHPLLAAQLLRSVPRMENIAETLLYQHKYFDGGGFPNDERRGRDLPLGARILHVVLEYDRLKTRGWPDHLIYADLKKAAGRFDPRVLDAFRACMEEASRAPAVKIAVPHIRDGMRIEEDVKTITGVLLVCQGQEVTPAVRQHLTKFFDAELLVDPVLVSTERTEEAPAAPTAAAPAAPTEEAPAA